MMVISKQACPYLESIELVGGGVIYSSSFTSVKFKENQLSTGADGM